MRLIMSCVSLWVDFQEKLMPASAAPCLRGGENGHPGEAGLSWGGNGAGAGKEAGEILPGANPTN